MEVVKLTRLDESPIEERCRQRSSFLHHNMSQLGVGFWTNHGPDAAALDRSHTSSRPIIECFPGGSKSKMALAASSDHGT